MKTAWMELNGRAVDDANIDGVDTKDYPDFCDAYFSFATYQDGTELSDDELDELTKKYSDIVNQMAHEYYI